MLTTTQVKHIAHLARLKLSSKEVEKFRRQLSEVLDYMKILKEVPTQKVMPTAQVTGLENIFREDKPQSSLSAKEVLSSAPSKYKGFFKTKAIFEK